MMPLVQELARGILGPADVRPVGLQHPVLLQVAPAEPFSKRDYDDAHLLNAVVDVHADDPEFGYRLIADELERADHVVSERRVWRLCSEHKVWSTTTKKDRRHSGKRPGPPVHDDLVQRDFSAPGPDMVWLTDITEHPTAKGKLYACCIKDVFSSRIVGCATGERMTADLAVSALRQAIARRQRRAPWSFIPTAGANFERGPSWRCSRRTTSPGRWAGSRRPATTPP